MDFASHKSKKTKTKENYSEWIKIIFTINEKELHSTSLAKKIGFL